ncbi:hypothetical protein D3C86_1451990 [compost metagenome]
MQRPPIFHYQQLDDDVTEVIGYTEALVFELGKVPRLWSLSVISVNTVTESVISARLR